MFGRRKDALAAEKTSERQPLKVIQNCMASSMTISSGRALAKPGSPQKRSVIIPF
jgi:hypothetical protein